MSINIGVLFQGYRSIYILILNTLAQCISQIACFITLLTVLIFFLYRSKHPKKPLVFYLIRFKRGIHTNLVVFMVNTNWYDTILTALIATCFNLILFFTLDPTPHVCQVSIIEF
jgi:hypothetical protein